MTTQRYSARYSDTQIRSTPCTFDTCVRVLAHRTILTKFRQQRQQILITDLGTICVAGHFVQKENLSLHHYILHYIIIDWTLMSSFVPSIVKQDDNFQHWTFINNLTCRIFLSVRAPKQTGPNSPRITWSTVGCSPPFRVETTTIPQVMPTRDSVRNVVTTRAPMLML